MSTEVTTYQEQTGLPALSAEQVRSRVNLIQQVMKGVMKNGVHYGTIPGCGDKPALKKPGAETLAVTFQLNISPEVHDLSTPDEAHFRVICHAFSQVSGEALGSGLGEASSDEEKYRWRKAVCDEEFDETSEDRRRVKWAKGKGGSTYQVKQVRTQPADVANTVLKMAKKRAQVDVTLSVTGASDIFSQDIEDLPDELRSTIVGDGGEAVQASAIGDPCLRLLLDEMKRTGLSEAQVKKNLAAKAKYTGELADMTHVVWEALYAGLVTMKTIPKKRTVAEGAVDAVTGEVSGDAATEEAAGDTLTAPDSDEAPNGATDTDGTLFGAEGEPPGRGPDAATPQQMKQYDAAWDKAVEAGADEAELSAEVCDAIGSPTLDSLTMKQASIAIKYLKARGAS